MSKEVVIKSEANGPNLVVVDGRVIEVWCRCGGSNRMPFCDGSNEKRGFSAPTREVKVT